VKACWRLHDSPPVPADPRSRYRLLVPRRSRHDERASTAVPVRSRTSRTASRRGTRLALLYLRASDERWCRDNSRGNWLTPKRPRTRRERPAPTASTGSAGSHHVPAVRAGARTSARGGRSTCTERPSAEGGSVARDVTVRIRSTTFRRATCCRFGARRSGRNVEPIASAANRLVRGTRCREP
jgi:hypothetical protein